MAQLVNYLMHPKESFYLKQRKKKIKQKNILLEGTHGREISGHIFSLAKVLIKDYPEFKVYIALKKDVDFDKAFEPNIVEHMSLQYLDLLATSEYLFNDTSFWSFFSKRKGQKYYIFWHGTPLKKLGKSIGLQGYGNIQRNLASADQIFVSNEFTKNVLIKDFGIEKIVQNQIVVAPSPRNSLLFKNDKIQKKRFLYMPTWRGNQIEDITISNDFLKHLKYIDDSLSENEEFYLKLHPFEESLYNIQWSDFKRIKKFPINENVYTFLQTVEVLITDYSSIMFDFSVTKRKIILFSFDEQEYFNQRGFYFDPVTLPFEKAQGIQELLHLMRSPSISTYDNVNDEYNSMDCSNGCELVLKFLMSGIENSHIKVYDNWNGLDNVLIYVSELKANGITFSLLNLLKKVNLEDRNYILVWQEGTLSTDALRILSCFPEGVFTFIQVKKLQYEYSELAALIMYTKRFANRGDKIDRLYTREFNRLFPNLNCKFFIHYPGFDRSYAIWMGSLKKLGIKTFIFVHTDMEKEFGVNNSLSQHILKDAYGSANHVVCVTGEIEKKIKAINPESNTVVMNMIIDTDNIQKSSEYALSEKIPATLKNDFDDSDIIVFISVGRFSSQKGFDRTISAFEKLANKNTRLILVGSYGPDKQKIFDQARSTICSDQIYLFDNLNEPFNLVRKSDALIFGSRYEGLGMVVFETVSIGIPVIMTNIPETTENLKPDMNVTVVSNSEEGIYQGMLEFIKSPLNKTKYYNFDDYNNKSVDIWNSLF